MTPKPKTIEEFSYEVVTPPRSLEKADDWSWVRAFPELRVRARVNGHSARLSVPMYDTHPKTVELAVKAAREHLEK